MILDGSTLFSSPSKVSEESLLNAILIAADIAVVCQLFNLQVQQYDVNGVKNLRTPIF